MISVSHQILKIEVIGEMVVLIECGVVGKERFLIDNPCNIRLRNQMVDLIDASARAGDESCFNEHGQDAIQTIRE